ncbi:MAG: tellurite resistance TerB family protein [Sulfurovum sp.]|nr:tellurite resistance TerB family protein [Sulfurovum sp.]
MDLIKVLGSLIASGALSKGSGGDVLGSIIGGALGGSQNQQTQGGGSMGDLLGSLIGAGNPSSGNGAGGLGDLLGSLIGGASTSSSTGGGLGDLLGSLVGGSAPQSQSTGRVPTSASDLEDLLGVGKSNNAGLGGAGGLGGLLTGALAKHAQQNNKNVPNVPADDYSFLPLETDKKEAVDHATLIIRAMVNAAKSDGSIDQSEQDKVLAKLGDITQEEIDFIKKEFAAPLDVESFARSIPKGMEQQIYMVSLMSIDLDKNEEARYLAELAKGLSLPTQVANQIHDKFGIPKIFA